MTARNLFPLAFAATVLTSCYYVQPVPEMPFRPYKPNSAQEQANAHANNAAYLAATQPGGGWYSAPVTPYAPLPSVQPTTPAPVSTPAPAPAIVKPLPELKPATAAPTPAPAIQTPATAITQSPLQLNPPTVAKPVTPPALKPATAPAPAANTSQDPKLITNKGPIPVATPVPGDPTRVYNPLDSSKTIRITDKNGKVYPSGKELKVRGTNFHFYVP